MFLRTVQAKQGTRVYNYLRLVESYKVSGRTKQRIIANIGNTETLNPKKLEALIKGLIKYTNQNWYTKEQLSSEKSYKYGDVLLVKSVWDSLGITENINHLLHNKNPEFNVANACFLMVLNRLLDPIPKIGISQWYKNKIYLDGIAKDTLEPHHFYRTLDYLYYMKDSLEASLFNQLVNLLNLDLSIVFYDLTSTYFEGTECEIAEFGYSRDSRPDTRQIVLGLVVTRTGIPIAHEVFNGNTADKSTVQDAVNKLKKKFNIQQCIFVGDRGLVSQPNLDFIQESSYQYIVALRKRQSASTFEIIEPDLTKYTQIKDNLLALDISSGDTRYIICHNKDKVKDDLEFRNRAIEEAKEKLLKLEESIAKGRIREEKAITVRVVKSLIKKHALKFFDFSFKPAFSWHLRTDIVAKEALLDGKYILYTDVKEQALSTKEVINAYKNLTQVEHAFRTMKDFIRLRPIYHWNETRVKAHVFICVLSYLIEKIIDNTLTQKGIQNSAITALNWLDDLRVVENKLGNQTLMCTTRLEKEQKEILSAFGIKNIPRVLSAN